MKNFIIIMVCVLFSTFYLNKAFSADLLLDSSYLSISPDDLAQLVPISPVGDNESTTTTQCDTIRELIEEAMPREVGDEKFLAELLDVRGTSWLNGFKAGELLELLGETGKLDGKFFENTVGFIQSENSIFKINLAKGEFRYINNARKFDINILGKEALGEKGISIVENLINYLGVPDSEIGTIHSKVLMGTAAPIQREVTNTSQLSQTYTVELETTFFVNRIINDVPVFNSFLIVGVSNSGEISRFRLKWPTLTMDPDLQKATPISREEVIGAVEETVLSHIGCEKPETLKMKIAYVPSNYEIQDDDNTKERLRSVVFAPKLLVFVKSEDNSQAGEILEFNLFDTTTE